MSSSAKRAVCCEPLEQRTLLSTTTAGQLDPSFNQIGEPQASLIRIAVQPDGKIVAAGTIGFSSNNYGTSSIDFFLARFNADGSLDANFGDRGTVRTDFGGTDSAADVAIDHHGRIVVCGSGGPNIDFAVARYLPNGKLDPSFAGTGKRLIPFGGADVAETLAITSDDKIILAGSRDGENLSPPVAVALARLNADGSFDKSFAGDGTELLALSTSEYFVSQYIHDVAIASDGKILIAGDTHAYTLRAFAARLLPNGSPDKTFGEYQNGVIDFYEFVDDSSGNYIAEPSPGVIVVATSIYGDEEYGGDFVITNNGTRISVLPSFTDGRPDSYNQGAEAILVQRRDHRVVIPAWVNTYDIDNGGPITTAIARFNPLSASASSSFTFDYSYGQHGVVTDASLSYLTNAALDPQDRVIAIADDANGDISLARFDRSGHLDKTFGGGDGTVEYQPPQVTLTSVATQPDSKVVVAGSMTPLHEVGQAAPRDFWAMRLNADGSLDEKFGDDGVVQLDFGGDDVANEVAVDHLGRIILAGGGGSGADFAVARYTSAGKLDATFAAGGKRLIPFGGVDTATSMAITNDNKILLAGERRDGGGSQRHFEIPLARLTSTGALDPTFSTDGKELLTLASPAAATFKATSVNDVALASGGKVLLAGDLNDGGGFTRAFAARLLDDGSADRTFVAGGVLDIGKSLGVTNHSTRGMAIAALTSNTYVLAASAFNGSFNTARNVVIGKNGSLVTELPRIKTASQNETIPRSILVQAGGRFIIAEAALIVPPSSVVYPYSPTTMLLLARFNAPSASGVATFDTSFGVSGVAQTDLGSDVTSPADALQGAALDPLGRILIAGANVIARFAK